MRKDVRQEYNKRINGLNSYINLQIEKNKINKIIVITKIEQIYLNVNRKVTSGSLLHTTTLVRIIKSPSLFPELQKNKIISIGHKI